MLTLEVYDYRTNTTEHKQVEVFLCGGSYPQQDNRLRYRGGLWDLPDQNHFAARPLCSQCKNWPECAWIAPHTGDVSNPNYPTHELRAEDLG